MIKAVIKYKVTLTRTVTMNCFSCKYGHEVRGRMIPFCTVGASSYQLDCIRDNYEHWEPKGDDAELVDKFHVAGVDE